MDHRYLKTLAAAALLLAGPAAAAATITVDTADDEMNGDGDCSLREAVEAANTDAAVDGCSAGDGQDTIVFGGDFIIALTMGELLVSDDVTIDAGTNAVVIDAAQTSRIFDLNDGDAEDADDLQVTLANLDLQNGNANLNSSAPNAGGAVDAKPGTELTMVNTDVRSSVAGINGGGVHGAGDAQITISATEGGESVFVGNVAQGGDVGMGGGGVWNTGTTTVTGDVRFVGNVANGASGSGGALFNSGGLMTLTGIRLEGNVANRAGAGIENAGGTLTATDVTVLGSVIPAETANPGNGGGLHSGGGDVTVSGGEFAGNQATEGGGIWTSGSLTIQTSDAGPTRVTNNTGRGDDATNGGGGVYLEAGSAMIVGAQLNNNTAPGASGSGGGLFVNADAQAVVAAGEIVANTANRAGGGVEVAGGTITLDGVNVSANQIPAATAAPGNGGGLHAGGGSVTVRGGQFTQNQATEGGGIWTSGMLTIEGNDAGAATIANNTGRGDAADNGGGGIYLQAGSAMISDATITTNSATGTSGSGGGLFVNEGAEATVMGSTISGNAANRAGAGIEVAGGTLTLEGVNVSTNVIPAATAMPGNGGGLHAGGGTVTVRGGQFTQNEATEGGGLWSNGTLTVESMVMDGDTTVATIANNVGRGDDATNGGGGVYAESGASVTITGATLSGNVASGAAGSGGAILVADGSLVRMRGGLISQNRANRAGGGIEVADDTETEDLMTSVNLVQVTVDGNEIDTPMPGNGGGLHAGGAASVQVDRSTFSNNAAREGAGLWIAGPSRLILDRSTVSTNASTEDGGGVYDNGGAEITLRDATIALNTAGGNGGGLLSQSEAFSFTNTVLAYNMADGMGADCSGAFDTDFAFVQDASGCDLDGDPMTGMDPVLGPLADNGGPTLTHLPDANSPLIDAGSSPFDVDQRGMPRVIEQADIGSVEAGGGLAAEDPVAATREWKLLPAAPNPSTTAATLRFTTAEAAPVRIALYNVLGQHVQTAFDGVGTPGTEQSIALDVSRLPAGLYVARMTGPEVSVTRRLTVVR